MNAVLRNAICRKEQEQKRACEKRAVVMPLRIYGLKLHSCQIDTACSVIGRRYFCFAGVAQPEEQAAFNRQAVGSSPTTCISFSFACVAQLAEQPALNRQVLGSSPSGSILSKA